MPPQKVSSSTICDASGCILHNQAAGVPTLPTVPTASAGLWLAGEFHARVGHLQPCERGTAGGPAMWNHMQMIVHNMEVSWNGGTPKWMVYRESAIKMDDLGVPPFMETPMYVWIVMDYVGVVEHWDTPRNGHFSGGTDD